MGDKSLTLSRDLRPADWLIARVHDFAVNVGSLVPFGFAGYARVLHPAYRMGRGVEVPVRWGEIAKANGKALHAHVQFGSLTGSEQPGLWDREPDEGSLPAAAATRLAAVLGRHTTTPAVCWFAVWDGWADLPSELSDAPTFKLPGRRYVLLRGPIDAAAESLAYGEVPDDRSANLWWPSDHGWCVATDIDLDSTYIGASAAAIAELLAARDLEVLPVRLTDRITGDGNVNGEASV